MRPKKKVTERRNKEKKDKQMHSNKVMLNSEHNEPDDKP